MILGMLASSSSWEWYLVSIFYGCHESPERFPALEAPGGGARSGERSSNWKAVPHWNHQRAISRYRSLGTALEIPRRLDDCRMGNWTKLGCHKYRSRGLKLFVRRWMGSWGDTTFSDPPGVFYLRYHRENHFPTGEESGETSENQRNSGEFWYQMKNHSVGATEQM